MLYLTGSWAWLILHWGLWDIVTVRGCIRVVPRAVEPVWTLSLFHKLMHCSAFLLLIWSPLFLSSVVSSCWCLVWYNFISDMLLFLSWTKVLGLCESCLSLRSLCFVLFLISRSMAVFQSLTLSEAWPPHGERFILSCMPCPVCSEGPSRCAKGIWIYLLFHLLIYSPKSVPGVC